MPCLVLTDDDMVLLRSVLVEARDAAEKLWIDADNSKVMAYHARMEDCGTLLAKLEPPRQETI